MPFQRHRSWLYPWETCAQAGQEFILTISANSIRNLWTSALRAVARSGVLVIHYHRQPRGLVSSPRLLRNILFEWHSGAPEPIVHASINTTLIALAEQSKPSLVQPFCPRALEVSSHPRVMTLLRELEQTGGAASILRYHSRYAVLMPLALLARFRADALAQTNTAGREAILAWLFEVDDWQTVPW